MSSPKLAPFVPLAGGTACEVCGTTAYECKVFARDEGIVDPICCEPERSLENIFPGGLTSD